MRRWRQFAFNLKMGWLEQSFCCFRWIMTAVWAGINTNATAGAVLADVNQFHLLLYSLFRFAFHEWICIAGTQNGVLAFTHLSFVFCFAYFKLYSIHNNHNNFPLVVHYVLHSNVKCDFPMKVKYDTILFDYNLNMYKHKLKVFMISWCFMSKTFKCKLRNVKIFTPTTQNKCNYSYNLWRV